MTSIDEGNGTAVTKSGTERWLLPLTLWLLPVVTVALGLRTWLPPLASDHGAGIDRMLKYLLISVGSRTPNGSDTHALSLSMASHVG